MKKETHTNYIVKIKNELTIADYYLVNSYYSIIKILPFPNIDVLLLMITHNY